VQYAHARIASILRQAKEQNVKVPEGNDLSPHEMERLFSVLTHETEIELVKKLADFPETIKVAATTLSPYRIANYTLELAAAFHSFYNVCRVLTGDEDLTKARLMLVKAVKQVLQNAFKILGISAPERM
jgi:arginyl-tRNA synthetase